MQRVPNYGSFLQAYGLKKILIELGADVEFIDFRPGKPAVSYDKQKRLKYQLRNIPVLAQIIDEIQYKLGGSNDFKLIYRMEYLRELGVGHRKKYNAKVDLALIGSDEVFNCLQQGANIGFAPLLFGQGVHCQKVASYAGSFGHTTFEQLQKYGLTDTLRNYFNKFAAISVRDKNSFEIIERMTGITPDLHVDPVLAADYDLPEIAIPDGKYAILYTYDSRVYTDEEQRLILDFCERNSLTLISLGRCQKWVPIKIQASPLEVLSYFDKADYVITDTFHGTVFSVKLNKKFACRIRDDNRNKLLDLLKKTGQEDRRINGFDELDRMYNTEPDYKQTNEMIEKEKRRTREYLNYVMYEL